MVNGLMGLEKTIGYSFRNPDLLKQALTHRSLGAHNNERLEFLGDSILHWVVTQYLYQHFPKATEGELTRMRARLVNGRQLSEIAEHFKLQNYIQVGLGEKKGGTFLRDSILSDAVEALLGAIYLDSDLPVAQGVLMNWLQEAMRTISPKTVQKDPKTQLQEWLQARGYPLPTYEVIKIQGPAHDQQFTVKGTVAILSQSFESEAGSKRIAEQMVAQQLLEVLSNHAS